MTTARFFGLFLYSPANLRGSAGLSFAGGTAITTSKAKRQNSRSPKLKKSMSNKLGDR
jgi:hypothetical protein